MTRKLLRLLLLLPVLAAGCATPLKGRHVYSVYVENPREACLYHGMDDAEGTTAILEKASLEATFGRVQGLSHEDAMLLVYFTKFAHAKEEDRIGEKVAAAAIQTLPPKWLERTRFQYCISDIRYNPWYRLSARTGRYIEDPDFDW